MFGAQEQLNNRCEMQVAKYVDRLQLTFQELSKIDDDIDIAHCFLMKNMCSAHVADSSGSH
jgi:hypothetical protein